jgi:hypothetical protein
MGYRIDPLCLVLLATTAVGCNSADDVAPEAKPAVVSAPAAAASPKPAAANAAKAPDRAESESQTVAQFSPPFPDREDLFEPPKRAQSTVRRDDAGETVELKGFVNVDQPQVILAIDGVISPIPEGGEKYGVQVISIEPPSVFLQRGRNRWKATLE